MFCGRIDLKGTLMKNRLILSTAALLLAVALPASAGVSIDRTSPSLGCPFLVSFAEVMSLVPPGGGCDAFGVGPVLEVMPISFGLGAMDNIDGLSANTLTSPNLTYHLLFSTDRASVGVGGTPHNASAANNQAASDLYRTPLTGGSPAAAMAACAPIGIPPPQALHRNQTAFNLIPTALAGAFVAGAQDNVDAVEMDVLDITGDNINDFPAYFSLDAASPALFASGADIYFSPAGGGAFFIFSFPPQMGLLAGDEIDSLVMWDRGAIGAPNPGVDMALFSLAPGSPTLAMIGASPAAIFVTNFNFAYCPFTPANQLGLLAADNVDGLDVMP
jgi:hypothetical protein